MGLKLDRHCSRQPRILEAQSNQRGIETDTFQSRAWLLTRRLNRTSVGLKRSRNAMNSTAINWLNRTSVGLKLLYLLAKIKAYYEAQSNQRGIETLPFLPLPCR